MYIAKISAASPDRGRRLEADMNIITTYYNDKESPECAHESVRVGICSCYPKTKPTCPFPPI